VSPDRSQIVRELRGRVAEFATAARDTAGKTPRSVLHPYFGPVSLRQTIVACIVHTRHHAEFLREEST
jgi:hypothetical protein